MLNIKRKYTGMIFLLLAINTSAPSYAKYYYNNHKVYKPAVKPVKKTYKTINIDKHPQLIANKSPEPSPSPDFGKDIDNLNKTSSSTKQDVVLLREMVNNLSKDLNEQKTLNSQNLTKQKDLENKAQALMLILFVTIFFLLIIIYTIYLKIKENSKKEIKENIDSFMKNTKVEILKDFKINETDFYAYTQNITTKKMDEFENSLDTRFGDYNRKITTTTEKEVNEFKSNLENDIKAHLDSFSSTVQNKFNENKEAFISQIQDKFPGTDINSMIVSLAEEQGFLQSINTQLENNVKDVVNKEFEKIEKHLNNKEKTIVADIQKVHLANNHFNIGNIFMKSKNYPQAIHEFLEAIRTDNNFYGAFINLGKAYESNEQSDKAVETYNKAIELKPQHYKAYFNLGNLYNSLGNYQEAIKEFNKVIAINPKYDKVYNNLGISYQMLEEKDKAKTNYQKALDLNHDYADAYANIAKLESETGDDIYFIAERYMKSNNAKQETFYKVKELAFSVTNRPEATEKK